ncbi:hypothetical protein EBB07_28320 [Paenibacillaceae bacterium]|nr:hypothetical protein EBB07_28320 [Paenibacillaceae bacterium]
MIIVKCSGEQAFGGRTEDTFVIEDYHTLDELKAYIDNKQPIICKEPKRYYKWNIIAEEQLYSRIVYLYNYLKIRKVDFYIMNKEDRQELSEVVCKNCSLNNDTSSSAFRCSYEKSENGCHNFEERSSISFAKWIKKIFSRSSTNE